MTALGRHSVLTAAGVLIGIAVVVWLHPLTAGGATFLVVIAILFVNAIGALVWRGPRPTGSSKRLIWLLPLPLALSLSACNSTIAGSVSNSSTVKYLLGAGAGAAIGGIAGGGGGAAVGALTGGAIGTGGAIAQPLRPVRAFAPAEEIPPPGVGAYGVLALKELPTPANRDRLEMACHAFLSSLPPQSSLPSSVPLADQMITFWPLATPEAPAATAGDCTYLTTHYDLYAGVSAIEDAERQGTPLSGRGPFLIGWSPSNTRGVPDAIVLVLDMSWIESQDSFDDMLQFWQHKIVENPAMWRSGFRMAQIRLAARDFADRYGDAILKAITFRSSGK